MKYCQKTATLFLIAALLLAGCVDSLGGGSAEGDAAYDVIADSPSDRRRDQNQDTSSSEVSPIVGTVALPNADVEGAGTARFDGVSFYGGIGTVENGTSTSSLIYEYTDWQEYGIRLFHALAPSEETLNVLYLYCTDESDDELYHIYHESYDLPMTNEDATGSCHHSGTEQVEVELFNFSTPPAPAQLVGGFSISGPSVNLADGEGRLHVQPRNLDLYPFEIIDCTSACTADPADGWWELHTVMHDVENDELCFGILYLMVADPENVSLGYGFCLQSLTRLTDARIPATWVADSAKQRLGTVPDGPRHPVEGYVLRPRLD